MKIVVYDVAASSSGALSILEDYHAKALVDQENEYCFLVGTPELAESETVLVKRFPWVKKSWFHRLFFDYAVAPKIVEKENPDKILSLQNTMVPRVRISQTVYEHNCLPRPFCDYRFSLVKEPGLWVRQNVLGAIIVRSLLKAQRVMVQTGWMKARCVTRLGIDPDKIDVCPPCLSMLPSGKYSRSDPFSFVYPATGIRFKNHQLILDACRVLVEEGLEFQVLFTVDGEEGRYLKALKKRVEDEETPIEFIGWQSRKDLFALYERSALLFTSEIESYPLPLFEAESAGCPIVAPNAEYAREALGSEGAFFYEQNSANDLARAMRLAIVGEDVPEDCAHE